MEVGMMAHLLVTLGLLLPVLAYPGAVSQQHTGSGAAAEGDPAPGRSPGPPEINPCDLDGDLIVVDEDKASISLNVTHALFRTDVLVHGVVYQVIVKKTKDDNNLIQGFGVHSLGDGLPRGEFSPAMPPDRLCKRSSVRGELEDTGYAIYNWTLPHSQIANSNVTMRLRYKVHSSSSVFQVNYVYPIYKDCRLWLKMDGANVSSLELPRFPDCQLYFPGHNNGHGLVIQLTRLNVPCPTGGYLQFSGNASQNRGHPHLRNHRSAHLCGKLEELADVERTFYFPNSRNHPHFVHLHGDPVFSLSYHLVDYCYNVTFTGRNGSFELRPGAAIQCTFKIHLPYGNRVILTLDIGDTSSTVGPDSSTVSSLAPNPQCRGLLTEVWDGSTTRSLCAHRGEHRRTLQIQSVDNRVVVRVLVRAADQGVGFRFSYRAEPVPQIVQQCSFGWVAVRQFCVTTVEVARLSWLQAESECNKRAGHLASIRNGQAQEIVDKLITNSPGYRDQNSYWIGASDKTYEGDFRWSDGLPFSYTNWFPGWSQHDYYNRQPNDDGLSDQDCVEIRRVYQLPSAAARLADTFMWNDRDCSTPNYFLCERLIADEPVEEGWPPECNRTLALSRQQPRASVSSPGFPRQYPDNADCDTEISAPPGYRLVLDFEELVLEKEPYCSYDYLEIIELGPSENGSVSRRLCGDWSAKLKLLRYVSTGSRLRLRFVSDYSHHYGGFKARVSMENALQCADDRLMMFNNSCYLFVSYPEVTWPTAQDICKGMRAQLASILTAEEQRFVTTNIRKTSEYRTGAVYWLGGRRIGRGSYQWQDGSSMNYAAWLPGQAPGQPGDQPPSTGRLPRTPDDNEATDPGTCLGVQWTSSPTPMLPSGLYWRAKKCSAVGGYVCKRHNPGSSGAANLNQNRTVNGTGGRLTSVNYPGHYYNNLEYTIRIVGPERSRLIIQFARLDIEPQLECLYDYVRLRSVPRRAEEGPGDAVKWCGYHDTDMQRFDFVSEGNEAELTFQSDYSITGGGFSAMWHAVDVSGCPLQTLTAREGVVTSPNYPHFLLARLDCAITILAPSGRRVWLEITDYDMGEGNEHGYRSTGRHSTEEVLELNLGGSSIPFQPFQTSGHLTEGAFLSTAERLQIRLRTGDRPLGGGFRATYKTVNGIQEERIVDLSNVTGGTLLHLNYPNPAPAHVDYLQHLIAPIGNVILVELYHVKFSENGCASGAGSLQVFDNYADSNGTSWNLCHDETGYREREAESGATRSSPVAMSITSYLNTLHVRQRGGSDGMPLNGSLRIQPDENYKIKLLRQEGAGVESCRPNPCQNGGKCVNSGGRKICQCTGHFTGLFCALTACELEPCVFGQCSLTVAGYSCQCQTGYVGVTCEQKQRPCEGNPCEGRGECVERTGSDAFQCRCHAWWEGARCERRMMHIPFRPLSERMLQEPFWLGLITVTVVLAVIGLVWCARRHFPEKLEKLLAEESDRNRYMGSSARSSSVRDQMPGGATATAAAAVVVAPSPQPGCQRSLFGRLGIRKPSILSLTSPHGQPATQHANAAAARTFSLDDLLKPPPIRTPSPRKKRNNSTPTKKNAAEKKQILQQLISPSNQQNSRKVSIVELIQLSERNLKESNDKNAQGTSGIKETQLHENKGASAAQITLSDPKLEKKVTFARLLNRVSAEMSSGSELDIGPAKNINCGLLKASSTPPSPVVEVRSPNSTSSNQGSDSLSSSDLALASSIKVSNTLRKKQGNKPASADSILQMFRNFSSSTAGANIATSIRPSPSTTPTASSPQEDAAGDDESSTSSAHTPVSYSSSTADSPPVHRKQSYNTIEVPVLDALTAHKSYENGGNLLHPPTILLEVPSMSNKCLSPIREMPTPLPTPLPTPSPSPAYTPILQRSNASSSAEDLGLDFSDDHISIELPCVTAGYSDGDEEDLRNLPDIAIDIHAEDGLIQEEAAVMQQACSHFKFKPRPPPLGQNPEMSINSNSSNNPNISSKPPLPPLIIPTLIVQQPSPTHSKAPRLIVVPGSPPPHRSTGNPDAVGFQFPDANRRRMLKDMDKPTSLDLPCAPPMITITCNMSEVESDAESLSPAVKPGTSHLAGPPGSTGMCYLSPFSMCTRADRTASESNLSSSGYSSMASPGPSRCGSNNPLCPSEMEDPGPPGPSSSNVHSQGLHGRRLAPLIRTSSSGTTTNTGGNGSVDQRGHCRGRSDSETLSDDPIIESNDEGIGTDHLDEKIDDGELKSAKELELYMAKDVHEIKVLEVPKLAPIPCITPSKCDVFDPPMDRLMPPPLTVGKVTLQLPSIVIQSDTSGCDKYISPVSSRSESPLSDRTAGLGRFSPNFFSKQKDLPFTDSDGLYDFPSSDCTPQNKTSVGSSMQQHRKSVGRRREKKSSRTVKTPSPTKGQTPNSLHYYHLDVPSKEVHFRLQTPRKPSPKRRTRSQQPISSSSSSESLDSSREARLSSSSPSPDTIRWSSPINCPGEMRHHPSETSGDDTGEEISSIVIPNVVDDIVRHKGKISRLRAISHQIRFLRRLEKSLKRKEKLVYHSDNVESLDGDCGDDGEAEELSQVTSPLLQSSHMGPKVEIRKSASIGKLQTGPGNSAAKFKRRKPKKPGDCLLSQEEATWKHVLISGNGHSD